MLVDQLAVCWLAAIKRIKFNSINIFLLSTLCTKRPSIGTVLISYVFQSQPQKFNDELTLKNKKDENLSLIEN